MDILLSTLNSRYAHASLGLRYLYANMGDLRVRTRLQEFTISQSAEQIAADILKQEPKIVGFGVYIWNTRQTLAVIKLLKEACPSLRIVIGGPEVSYESETQEICQIADHVIKGEGDLAFQELCLQLLSGEEPPKFLKPPLPDLENLISPYSFYNDNDLKNRTLYVEASRGCPYHCEFCLSSLDQSVRNIPLEKFLADMESLVQRGARQFKFVDRTFNLSPKISAGILKFFLEHADKKIFLHFEMVPDRLPDELRLLIERYPPGALQFEIGIQTFDEKVAALVSRRQNYAKTCENLRYLRAQTGVYIHADLIAGLPGENEDMFGRGFDQLVELNPHEIQVGILKRLKGTPIIRHDLEWQMLYDAEPPFQVKSTQALDEESLKRIGRFAKYWDRLANSANFPRTLKLLKEKAQGQSFYALFMGLSEFLYARFGRDHTLSLEELTHSLLVFLTETLHIDGEQACLTLAQDYASGGQRKLPRFLGLNGNAPTVASEGFAHLPKRQRRHFEHSSEHL